MKRLLVAHDLTDGSRFALGRALRLAAESRAAVRILHVPDRRASSNEFLAARKTLQNKARLLMEELSDRELDLTFRISHEVPKLAILGEAERFDADLVLIGAHGEPNLRDVLFGTTAAHLVHKSVRPLLVVQNDDSIPYSKLMAAVDSVSAAENALRAALELAPNGEIFAIHAFEPKMKQLLSKGEILEQIRSDQELALERLLEKVRPGSAPSLTAHTIVEQGEVLSVIMDSWLRINPDLVIMATHGRSGFSHMLHGSFTDYVLLGCRSDILVSRIS